MRKISLKSILAGLFVCIPAACAAGPPPPPPLLGGPGAFGIGWIILCLIAIGVVALWKKTNNNKKTGTGYITTALNDINDRLKKLEEKMNRMEK
ncbi:MAG: hypothetical protein DRH37_05005 [Deltaproteobacteria bacterium]|nr:MAG: hypothetical protein DRH37_05005 [Deltaproteobacteria bacterium]